MAQQAELWLKQLSGTDHPADYFQHPLAFPMLLLPWWLEQTIHPEPDLNFQADLIYSSINGYYFIRMIDNVMDGHSTTETKLLPLLGYFHTQFQTVYQTYFDSQHPFWSTFKQIGIESAESTLRDAMMTDIDLQDFIDSAGKKVAGGKIPLAAVCYRCDRSDLYPRWQQFYDKLGCWHQLYNDLFGWVKDLRTQTPTYFLSEGNRRKAPNQSVEAWVIHEGFAWGIDTLEHWLDELQGLADGLQSPHLVDYLRFRQEYLQQQAERTAHALAHLDRLLMLEP